MVFVAPIGVTSHGPGKIAPIRGGAILAVTFGTWAAAGLTGTLPVGNISSLAMKGTIGRNAGSAELTKLTTGTPASRNIGENPAGGKFRKTMATSGLTNRTSGFTRTGEVMNTMSIVRLGRDAATVVGGEGIRSPKLHHRSGNGATASLGFAPNDNKACLNYS